MQEQHLDKRHKANVQHIGGRTHERMVEVFAVSSLGIDIPSMITI